MALLLTCRNPWRCACRGQFGAVLIHGLRVYTYVPVHAKATRTVWAIAAAYTTGFLALTGTMV